MDSIAFQEISPGLLEASVGRQVIKATMIITILRQEYLALVNSKHRQWRRCYTARLFHLFKCESKDCSKAAQLTREEFRILLLGEGVLDGIPDNKHRITTESLPLSPEYSSTSVYQKRIHLFGKSHGYLERTRPDCDRNCEGLGTKLTASAVIGKSNGLQGFFLP